MVCGVSVISVLCECQCVWCFCLSVMSVVHILLMCWMSVFSVCNICVWVLVYWLRAHIVIHVRDYGGLSFSDTMEM